jgi:transposase
VLRPDQLAIYEEDRQRRSAEVLREMNELGVQLPADWDELEFGP